MEQDTAIYLWCDRDTGMSAVDQHAHRDRLSIVFFSDFISKQKIPIYSQIFINKFNYKLPLILIGRVGTCTRARADKRCLLIVRLGLVHLSLELSIAIPILRMDLDHQIKERTPQ